VDIIAQYQFVAICKRKEKRRIVKI
jgi:hypothetical protein